ncbi:DUF4112 domain-containing protein [Dermatobacter hominis]|uniref:DUF4112 domain-containing protein n=1 Tax=Dermatobacter hominis TaxID=2884263 RepID=UPI001D12968C|nr:DUF4112 domain-containing protein [Dermatobacter hominis]UDY37840.1 DUF4112 domain-containing protein [Dermatobacter hominis]
MGDDVRDLGTIQGYEITPGGAAPPPPPPPGAPTPPPPPQSAPPPPPAGPVPTGGPGQQLVPAAPPTGSRTGARAEVVEALHDIRDAHRRGPKPNSRPLPRWVERMAWVLDDAIEIPATGGRRVGIDGFITLIPGVGDAVGVALSMVVVTAGVLAGVSWPTIIRMLLNVGFEGVVGLIPFAGVVFDMAYKANDRNVRLIEADLADRSATRRSSLGIIVALVLTTIVGMLMMLALSLLGIAVIVWVIWRLIG